jgi:uncharacterized repeat protein (TIGR02543 family)
MKKKLLTATLLFVALGLSACVQPVEKSKPVDVPSSSEEASTFTVSFHKNDGTKDDVIETKTVNKGEKVARPDDPTWDGRVFNNWFKDADCLNVYDFNKTITKNTNLYAGWFEILDVTFNLNYEGAPQPTVTKVTEGQAIAEPSDPNRSGFAFTGWMLSASGPQYYDFTQPVQQKLTLYASWGAVGSKKVKAKTFEAEYCPCITEDRNGLGMQGATYSGGSNGRNLIQKDDTKQAKASNGYFVHHLYEKGNNLVFDLNVDVEDTKATIYMRLSAEYKTPVQIDADMYKVKVNGVAMNYGSITFENVPPQGDGWKPFSDYLLTAEVTLKAGANKIEMITDNMEKMYGTALSTAPMVDCLKVYSTSEVTWPTAKPANLISNEE